MKNSSVEELMHILLECDDEKMLKEFEQVELEIENGIHEKITDKEIEEKFNALMNKIRNK